MKNQIKLGSVIAYINIFLHLIISIFLTPFLIRGLGEAEYGVYKIIQSFSAQLGIMSFGIATLVSRNVVFYTTKQQKKEKENFLFMAHVMSFVLAALVLFVGFLLYLSIDTLYSRTLTSEELALAKRLFSILIFNVALSVVCDSFTGLIRAHEKFAISNGISMMRLVLRLASIFVLISVGSKSVSIVTADLLITMLALLISAFYGKVILHEKAHFYYFDKKLLKTCLTFSFAVFLQAIVTQVNNNVDNIILGAMKGATVVTVYSVGLSLYGVFASLVDVFRGMFGPRATRLVANGADGETLTDFAITPARMQSMVAFLGIVGFIIIGKDFIIEWLGEGFIDVYRITLILIIPAVFPLVESITYEILDAKMKRLGRSIILLCMCFINIGISIICINVFGYIGAAFGTAFSLIVGDGVLMNLYLHHKIGLNIPKLFGGVLKGILPCAVISCLISFSVRLISLNGWFGIIVKAAVIIFVYGLIMYLFGMNTKEKEFISQMLKKLSLTGHRP